MMFLSKNWYFSVQKALIYYTVNKSHHNSFILLVFSHVANSRYVANFRFLTLQTCLISFVLGLMLLSSCHVGHASVDSLRAKQTSTYYLVKVLHSKLPGIGKQLTTFSHRVWDLSRRPQRCEVSVLPLHHLQ